MRRENAGRRAGGPLLLLLALALLPAPVLAGEERVLPFLPTDDRIRERCPQVALLSGYTMTVGIYRDRESGEETGPPDTWPKERLLIEVTPQDGKGVVLFHLDPSFGWNFLGWGATAGGNPSSGTVPEFMVFRVERRDINRTDPDQLWEVHRFRVRVGGEGGYIVKEESGP